MGDVGWNGAHGCAAAGGATEGAREAHGCADSSGQDPGAQDAPAREDRRHRNRQREAATQAAGAGDGGGGRRQPADPAAPTPRTCTTRIPDSEGGEKRGRAASAPRARTHPIPFLITMRGSMHQGLHALPPREQPGGCGPTRNRSRPRRPTRE